MDSIINEIVIKSYHMQYFLTVISQLALYRGLYMTMEKAAYKKLKRVTLSVKCLFISQKISRHRVSTIIHTVSGLWIPSFFYRKTNI